LIVNLDKISNSSNTGIGGVGEISLVKIGKLEKEGEMGVSEGIGVSLCAGTTYVNRRN
jgi:hypothetical protein